MSGGGRREEIRAHLDSTRAQLEATNARIEKKAGRNLFLAIGVGLLLGAVFVGQLAFLESSSPVFVALLVWRSGLSSWQPRSALPAGVCRGSASPLGALSMVAAAYFYGAEGLLLSLFAAAALPHDLARHRGPHRRALPCRAEDPDPGHLLGPVCARVCAVSRELRDSPPLGT